MAPKQREKKIDFHALKSRVLSGDRLVAFISVLKKIEFFFPKTVSNCGFLRILVSLVWIHIRDPDLPESLDPDLINAEPQR
jgi:hypothetical protein